MFNISKYRSSGLYLQHYLSIVIDWGQNLYYDGLCFMNDDLMKKKRYIYIYKHFDFYLSKWEFYYLQSRQN